MQARTVKIKPEQKRFASVSSGTGQARCCGMETFVGGLQTGVLVVEDNDPFSAFVCAVLDEYPQLKIVGKVQNGLDAIRQAEQLEPGLILMDIALPGLNGIAVALHIRSFLPDVKIVFLTQESSPDVVRECLQIGTCGYVLKLDAGRELSRGIDAVMAGRGFLSSTLACPAAMSA